MPCVDVLVDDLRVLGDLLAQELLECGDVESDEATSAFPDDAVLEQAAFVLAPGVSGGAPAFGYLRDPAGARIGQHREQKLNVFIGKLSIGRFERSPMPCFSSCLKMPFMHVRQLPLAS
ncbi:MAG: hypothetical protein BHV61_06255 [Collinsella sp. 60_9]|nr:MAG: hypothetical protein BHV61_06255 [Collinsella sp. 60_9]